MNTMTHWKTDIGDLRVRAQAVHGMATERISARTAARCIRGVIQLVANRFGVDAMQQACADLARNEAVWSSKALPTARDGVVPEPLYLIAVVVQGILPLAGIENTRSALAFWASEDDTAVWLRVTG